jgi:O-antigen/teichoic acid export membrane protein
MGTLNTEVLPARSWTLPWIGAIPFQHVREYGPTIATEFTVMCAQIVAYKLAAHFLGTDGFSEYAVARRAATLISPLPLLGLAVGLPRYIAYSNGCGDAEAASRYYGATLRCVACAIVLCLGVLNLLREQFAFLIFGDRGYAHLILPISLMVLGLSLHGIVYSYFRGHLIMKRANVLQIVNLAGVPILCFVTLHQSVGTLIFSLGLLWSVVAFAALCFTPVQQIALPARRETGELLRYGVQRLPGEFVLMAMLSLPVIFMAHRKIGRAHV